jgi:hypothetical protein
MRNDRHRLRRAALAGSVAVVCALSLPALSGAAIIVVGALGKTARTAYPEPVDTAFWLTAGKGGAGAVMPATGLVRLIRLRGCARRGAGGQAPLTQIHFQTLAPGAGGAVTVALTTAPLSVPVCGAGADPATVTSFSPGNLCVRKGDYVAFNDEGGAGPGFPRGVRYEIFGPAPGADTDSFTGAGATNNGDTLTGTVHTGVRLLMAIELGTGHDAGVCRR